MVASSRPQRQSKTANTPILVINAYNLDITHTNEILDQIDDLLNDNNVIHRYAFKQGYLPNIDFLQALKLFFKSDGFAGLSLNEYLRELYGN